MNTIPQAAALREEAISPEFRKEAIRSIFAIAGFIVVYLLLFALSIGLVAISVYGGISVIIMRPAFYTLLIGGGLIGFGVMIFVFLIKFLFATSREEESDSIEITAKEQPLLFETIYDLARETAAPIPRKVFLSADVNACVFYQSSFWSLF